MPNSEQWCRVVLYIFTNKDKDITDNIMKPCNDPIFFIDMYNVGRGFVGKKSDHETPYIKHSNFINIWRIVDDNLQKINKIGLLFDTETYLIQWNFELALKDTVQEESLFYYWKGDKATKGFSPLPEEIENQNPIVERISQWSEPAFIFPYVPLFF
ncbi:hypothetical protein NQ317_015463 [Molorchus minor]|uniref:Uncharacterized protein n=1 Tax=Molorchus minor TaxID=1323400 RepID=A0ABQ9JTV6_9CUCU|nr:hypothetical protein NQ317_015463 [Molorchus minor]